MKSPIPVEPEDLQGFIQKLPKVGLDLRLYRTAYDAKNEMRFVKQ